MSLILVNDERRRVLEKTVEVAIHLLNTARTRRISVKMATLVKYAYLACRLGTLDITALKQMKVHPPHHLRTQYFYREVVKALRKRRIRARVEHRHSVKYLVLYKSRCGVSGRQSPEHVARG